MNNNNTISDKQLKNLFKQINLTSPSSGFMENLMGKVEVEALKQAKRQKWILFLQMAAGIFVMLLFPILYIYFFVPDFFSRFALPPINLEIKPTTTLTGLAVLLLLVADTLLRQHYFSKRK
ncbi:MAG: hypothetical protein LBH32_06510 [Dysgonamonadaceae bacterium]|jgi:protein-S-isoprenylcysteine O-methyltransferase Ste14|nr:hypothetical protein [Dysgonamonadaceae bacterium]